MPKVPKLQRLKLTYKGNSVAVGAEEFREMFLAEASQHGKRKNLNLIEVDARMVLAFLDRPRADRLEFVKDCVAKYEEHAVTLQCDGKTQYVGSGVGVQGIVHQHEDQ